LNAEKSYETVTRFLSDPKRFQRLTVDEFCNLSKELAQLREKLENLERFRTPRAKGEMR
jgi:hypothetical protein